MDWVSPAARVNQMKHLISFGMTTIGIVAVAALLPSFFGRERSPQLVSDVGAEIRLVACSVTSARTSSLRNAELVTNIVNGLPRDVHVLLMVSDRSAFSASPSQRRVTFVEMPPQSDISIWPQDPFVVVQDGATTKLITPCSFDREDDELMAGQLAKLLELEVISSELHFEGGNIVCGADAVLIGYDTIDLNVMRLSLTEAEVLRRFEKLFGRPVIVVGDEPQSVGHIDLIVAPLDDRRIVVADSRRGAELAEAALAEEPQQVEEFEMQCEQGFFGHAKIAQLQDRDGNEITRPDVHGETRSAIAASLQLAPALDAIDRQLSDAGYEVVRIPALIPDQQGPTDENGRSQPTYPFLTYANVLTEKRNDQLQVYLPQYGFKQLDDVARRTWRELGYQVHPVSGFATSAMYGGAMRCCTKVLQRN
ncbi:MAG TPA: hypothetical protein DCY79_21530 [Planctomycetaceae bacterium]|nr:hypothetical protein [Blastopirellula sp.]HAY82398.1 hypothetical protein [Planctomycetaceae bacterium]